MRGALAQRTQAPAPARERRRDGGCRPPAGGRLTLDQLISSAWAGVTARSPVACPWCGGRMVPEADQSARCRSCLSSLT